MEMLSNVVLSDLASRSISYLFAKYEKQKTATEQEHLQRLRHLLLRTGTIVEEADRRLVTNGTMLRQLEALRGELFRGHYVLDVVRCKDDDDKKDDEVSRRAFSISRFNPAKRFRSPSSGDPEIRLRAAFGGASSLQELQQMVQSLEAMIGDTKEFIVFLTSYPITPLYRQPYSAHMFIDKCMFGRHMEKERIMEFLLQVEPPGAAKLGVLPIVGRERIGKSTLVEHVCNDERVRKHFSLILFYSQNDLKDEAMANFKDKCLIKHQNDKSSGERRLIVIELLEDVDEEKWNSMMHSSERSIGHGSRIFITSRSKKIVRFGTTHALRLKCLPTEAYWYFFKMVAFGSDGPGQHPKLASLALEMADLTQGCFILTAIIAVLLRENFNTQSWSRMLKRLREYMQKNVLTGKKHHIKAKDRPRISWSMIEQKPDRYFMLYGADKRDSKEEVPQIQLLDLQAGRCDQPPGEYEVLVWKSRIPPYFNYTCKCKIRDM